MIDIPRPGKLILSGTFEKRLDSLIAYLERLVDVLRKNFEMLEGRSNANVGSDSVVKSLQISDDAIIVLKTNGAIGKINLSKYDQRALLPVIESGNVVFENVSNAGYTEKTIKFSKKFLSPPKVIVYQTGYSMNRFIFVCGVTETEFKINAICSVSNPTTVSVGWIAIEDK